MLPMDEVAPRRLLSCGCSQPYHQACLLSWFRVSPTCPTCRAAVLRPPSPLPSPRRDTHDDDVVVVVVVGDDDRRGGLGDDGLGADDSWLQQQQSSGGGEVVVSRSAAFATEVCCCCTFCGYFILTAL